MNDAQPDSIKNRSALLNQPQIDRDCGRARKSRLAPALICLGALFLALLGAVYWQHSIAQGAESSRNASGYIAGRRQATVSSQITGKVADVRGEGGLHVKAGEIITGLDDARYRAACKQTQAHLAQSQATVYVSQIALNNANQIFERSRTQFWQGIISAQLFDNAKAEYEARQTELLIAPCSFDETQAAFFIKRQNLSETIIRTSYEGAATIRTPQAGVIVFPVSAGSGFTRTGIGTIVGMDPLEVEADVCENFIHRISTTKKARARLNAFPDWDIPDEAITVTPTVDRTKATVKVRIALPLREVRILQKWVRACRFCLASTIAVQASRTRRYSGAAPCQTSC